jgi:cell division protease FtsH
VVVVVVDGDQLRDEPKLGSVTIGEAGGEVFLGAALQDLGSVGPHTLDLIDEETERLVDEAQTRAEHVLRANWASVLETAGALLEQETLSGLALDALLSTVAEIELDGIPLPDRG